MKCSSCGHENAADAKFCQRCGSSLSQNPTSQKESFFKANKVLIIAITVIICVSVAVGTFVYMNMNHGPQLSDYDISEFTEGDVYVVSLVDENGTPMQSQYVEFICYNQYGGSTTISNITDYQGQTSFILDYREGTYKIDVNYILLDESTDPTYTNVTGFSKQITIKKGPYPYFNEEFLEKNKKYVAYTANITIDPDSYYNSETIHGWDYNGNEYVWYGGDWFNVEDIDNGNVDMMY